MLAQGRMAPTDGEKLSGATQAGSIDILTFSGKLRMIYLKSALAGIAAIAVLAFLVIVYLILKPGQDIHLVDTFTYEVGLPWVRQLLPTRTVIALTLRVFPDG